MKYFIALYTLYSYSIFAQGSATNYGLSPKKVAIELIKFAEIKSQVKGDKIRLRRMGTALSNARLLKAPMGSDWEICQNTQGMAAFVNLNKLDNIYLCEIFYNQEVFARAQLLVHESAHLSGIKDECKADLWAVTVMTYSGIPNQVRSGYQCY